MSFATDIFSQLKGRSGNLFLSPESLYIALAMTHAGAKGATADEIANVLHVQGKPELLKQSQHDFMDMVSGDKTDYQLVLANSYWAQQGFEFLPAYVKLLETEYLATAKTIDFKKGPAAARTAINAWVDEKTMGRIHELLGVRSVNEGTRLVLVNAIYFKAGWQTQFVKRANDSAEFLSR